MNRVKIVAIDDVCDILDLIQYNLEKEGMEVKTFSDGTEAIKQIPDYQPHVVISDWMMPQPDGIEICKILKNNLSTRHIPIIMLTCRGDIQDYRKAIEAGASDFIAKPVRMEELVRRIKLLLPSDGLKKAYAG
jgi:two-component system alkaline phosphatase synthesis response regulator PhoP